MDVDPFAPAGIEGTPMFPDEPLSAFQWFAVYVQGLILLAFLYFTLRGVVRRYLGRNDGVDF